MQLIQSRRSKTEKEQAGTVKKVQARGAEHGLKFSNSKQARGTARWFAVRSSSRLYNQCRWGLQLRIAYSGSLEPGTGSLPSGTSFITKVVYGRALVLTEPRFFLCSYIVCNSNHGKEMRIFQF